MLWLITINFRFHSCTSTTLKVFLRWLERVREEYRKSSPEPERLRLVWLLKHISFSLRKIHCSPGWVFADCSRISRGCNYMFRTTTSTGSEIGTRFTPLNIAWLVTVALWIYSHGCTHFTSCNKCLNNSRKGKCKISAWKSLAPIYSLVIFIQHCYTQSVALEGQCRPMSQELSVR